MPRALPGGDRNSHTSRSRRPGGSGGHIADGGFGFLSWKYGLSAENVLDALVDADGRVRRDRGGCGGRGLLRGCSGGGGRLRRSDCSSPSPTSPSIQNTSWLGSLINTIIGNLKLSITNIHIRYEDLESNPGHPFAAGLTLGRLSAMTVDDAGKETFATGGALEHLQKSVELECLAFYLDSDTSPWSTSKQWEDLHPSEWNQIFELEKNHSSSALVLKDHCYILQPVTGNARYTKIRLEECMDIGQPLQKASINLEDVTLCLSKDGYKDILRLADNFAAFNQRLKYAHYRPHVPIKTDARSWWKYAYKVVTNEMKAASGMLSWEQVLRYARLRKKYISVYASLLKSDASRMVVDDNEEIKKLDRELDIDVILQWRSPNLQILSIRRSLRVTDSSIAKIANFCPTLQELST